jgi:peptidoglycan/LPS O-acetylase OafA/YrhL
LRGGKSTITPVLRSEHIAEIDGLRAVAVLAVIGFHYLPRWFPLGYLGVDLFFVISGFVITRQILSWPQVPPQEFLLSFYLRRFRRIAPALFASMAITMAMIVILGPGSSKDMFLTAGYAAVGLSNFFLYFNEADYFALDLSLNAFSHTWSLGVEEQYYLIFPLLISWLGVNRKTRSQNPAARATGFFLAISAASLFGWIACSFFDRDAMFYLLPFRAWELGAGIVACLVAGRFATDAAGEPSFALSALVATSAFLLVDVSRPLLSQFGLVLATAFLLIALERQQRGSPVDLLALPPLSWIGRMSYPLYLYHWPLYVLATVTLGRTAAVLTVALTLTFLFASLSTFWIERAGRRLWSGFPDRIAIRLSIATATLAVVAMGPLAYKLVSGENRLLAYALGIEPAPKWPQYACHGYRNLDRFADPLERCLGRGETGGPKRTVFLLGDSHAVQWLPAIQEIAGQRDWQVRYLNSGLDDQFPNAYWGEGRPESDRIIPFVKNQAIAGDLLVITFHRGRFNPVRDIHLAASASTEPNSRSAEFVSNMIPVAQWMTDAGVKVLLIADTPLMSIVAPAETCKLQARIFGVNECAVSRTQDARTRYRQASAFAALASAIPGVRVFDPFPAIYGNRERFDPISPNGDYLMVDAHHLTPEFVRSLAPPLMQFIEPAVIPD